MAPSDPYAQLITDFERSQNEKGHLEERVKRLLVDLSNVEKRCRELEFQVLLCFSFSRHPVNDIPLLADL